MRVLVVDPDPDPARAALVAEGLAGIEPPEVRRTAAFVLQVQGGRRLLARI